MLRIFRLIAVLAVATAVSSQSSLPVLAQAEDLEAYGDEYWPADFGRVTYHENGLTIHRGAVDPGLPPLEEATVNSPVFPGDSALTGVDQRGEIQLASGTLVRLDQATDVTFLSLPDPYAEFSDNSVLQLTEGTIRVTTRLQVGEEFRIDTPASSVYLVGEGDFRVEVTSTGRTEVVSRGGVAEVVGNGGSALLRGGTRTEVFPGSLPEEPWAFNTFVTDSFDSWVDGRDAVYRVWNRYEDAEEYAAETVQALPPEVQPYYHELEHYGEWAHADDYGYVWYPTDAPAGWTPYHDGYWSHGPRGYFWVSYEPWGWAPYHYGSWNWVAGFGWCWAPGGVFSGAWVAWSWGSTHIGWAPLDYWGRPAHSTVVQFGYYDPGLWTFVDYVHIERRDYRRHAVRVGDVGDIRDATVVTRAPDIPPRLFAESPEQRHAARRMAQDDRGARIRRIDDGSPPRTAMIDVERRIRSRGAAGRSSPTPAAPPDARIKRDRSGSTRPDGAQQRPAETRFPGYGRRISTNGASGRQGPERRSGGRSTAASGATTGTRLPSGSSRSSSLPYGNRGARRTDPEQRVRDTNLRTTNPRSQRGSAPSRRRPSAPRSGSSATRKREDSRNPSRSSSPSRGSTPSRRARDAGAIPGKRPDTRRPSSYSRPVRPGSRSTPAPRTAPSRPQPGRRPTSSRSTSRPTPAAGARGQRTPSRSSPSRPASRPAARPAPKPASRAAPTPARSRSGNSSGKSEKRGNKR